MQYTGLLGNGYCDDVANNKECNYDGGDCCGICVNKEYCIKCECIEDVYLTSNVMLGNGYCDQLCFSYPQDAESKSLSSK